MKPSEGSLAGRVVLVTGGNKGIGLGLGLGVARAGADVVIWGRDEAANAAAIDRLKAAGAQAAALVCDVTDEAQVTAAFAATLEQAGKVDAVFANAGTNGRAAPFVDQTDKDWQRVMAVNVHGVVLTLRAAVRHMLERGEGGSLVGVASMAARVSIRHYSPYCTSKAAVVGLMQTLAVEYARKGIRANALLPGWVDTDMTGDATPEFRDKVVRRTPANRFGHPDDFGGVAAFLADPAQLFHTGDTVLLDGGYTKV